MSVRRFVRTRTPGSCSREFAHPSQIDSGDIVRITTYYPRDEATRDFGVKPFSRSRECQWCVLRSETMGARRGLATLRLRDRHGDVWMVGDDGLLHAHDTAPFSFEHVEGKWGPLHVHRSVETRDDEHPVVAGLP